MRFESFFDFNFESSSMLSESEAKYIEKTFTKIAGLAARNAAALDGQARQDKK